MTYNVFGKTLNLAQSINLNNTIFAARSSSVSLCKNHTYILSELHIYLSSHSVLCNITSNRSQAAPATMTFA